MRVQVILSVFTLVSIAWATRVPAPGTKVVSPLTRGAARLRGTSDGARSRVDVGSLHPWESLNNVTMKDDAWHFNASAKKEELWYTEWWYLNFDCKAKDQFDPTSDPGVGGIYVMGAWDPASIFGVGQSILYSIHYNEDNTTSQTNDLRPAKTAFEASTEVANVTIAGTNTLRALNATTYHIKGASANGQNTWDLTYSAVVDPMFFYENSPAGAGGGSKPTWQEISWLVYMPRAMVNGVVTTKGESHTITNCPGYHDHDWGKWFSFGMKWAWINFSNSKVAVVGGASAFDGSSPANNVWVHMTGQSVQKFVAENSSVKYTNFVSSDIPLHKYPLNAQFTSHNADYKLDLQWKVLVSPGIWKSAVVVFEQQSEVTCTLTPLAGGDPIVFTGLGFTEWTDLLV